MSIIARRLAVTLGGLVCVLTVTSLAWPEAAYARVKQRSFSLKKMGAKQGVVPKVQSRGGSGSSGSSTRSGDQMLNRNSTRGTKSSKVSSGPSR